ncbi:MAG: helix-turn-helix domain-containing protein [Pyrinomonadaceae bacterium]
MKDAALMERREFNLTGEQRNSRLPLNESTLPGKLEVLKTVALNLLKEVQALSTLEATDIMRGIKFYDEVERFEKELITRALELTGGHQVRASRLLGLKVTTLNSKVKRYRIPLPGDAPPPPASSSPSPGPFPAPVHGQ